MQGSGGKGRYWWTEGDACKELTAAKTPSFSILLQGTGLNFAFSTGDRLRGGSWISQDAKFQNDTLIAHVTMGIEKLSFSDDEATDGGRAKLEIANFHFTVRRTVDSEWIETNAHVLGWAGAVANYKSTLKKKEKFGDQGAVMTQAKNKFNKDVTAMKGRKPLSLEDALEKITSYKKAQENSVHIGLNGDWNSGNKANSETALQTLGFDDPDNAVANTIADSVKELAALVATRLATNLKGLEMGTDKQRKTVRKVLSALVVINASIEGESPE